MHVPEYACTMIHFQDMLEPGYACSRICLFQVMPFTEYSDPEYAFFVMMSIQYSTINMFQDIHVPGYVCSREILCMF